ncbi:MAG TPA: T9SS type B sorting domain-containing protein, partial [Saprospiraceae bacterium]|nr:T9SS type B sorting domain-containing protein [Saprospiraceae bacterium]
ITNSIEIGLSAGDYNTFVKDKNGCLFNSGIATIAEPLQFTVSLGPDFVIKLRQDTQLFALVTNGIGLINYKWIVYDTSLLSCQNCPNPKLDTLFNPVLFKVIVTDENGCSASDDLNVLIDKTRKVFVPTAFTPNGDLINDVLLTHGETDAFIKTFQIFDAWGEVVFQADNFKLGDENIFWDGKFNGQMMNVGTFVWYMDIKYIDGVTELLKGSFDLLR